MDARRRDLVAYFAGFVLERLDSARAANLVHVPLRQDGAKPRAELAAPVEIIEERFSAALGFAQAVQIGVKRIGEVARGGVLPGGIADDGSRRAIKLGAKFRHEKIPRGGIAKAACKRQREVGGVQRFQIRFDFLRVDFPGIGRGARKSPRGADFERGLKLLAREIPFRGRGGPEPAAFDRCRKRRGKLQSGGRRGRGSRDLR